MKSLKILYVGNLNLPYGNAAATRVINNSKIFADLGNIVYIIGNSQSTSEEKNTWVEFQSKIFINKSSKFSKWFGVKYDTEYIIRQIKELDIDLIIAYNLSSLLLMRLIVVTKRVGKMVLSDVTEWYSAKGYIFPFNLLKFFDVFLRMKVLNKKLDGLIVISEYLANYYKKNRVLILPPLVDINDSSWLNITSNFDDMISHDFPIFSYVGSIGKYKDNLLQIIKSFVTINQEFKLNIIGVGLNDLKKISREYYSLCIKNKNINFYDKVNYDSAIKHVFNSDFSLIIRDNNRMNNAGFPTKFVEAATCHTSVIATNISNISQYSNCVNIHFVELETLSESLINLVSNFQKANRIGNKQNLSSIFHFKNYIDQTEFFLNNIFDNQTL